MNDKLIPILFAVGTALFWGCYGPTIGNAQAPKPPMGPPLWSPFKPYVFIGVAYLFIGIIGGLIAMKIKGDSFSYGTVDGVSHFPTAKWGFLAGALGAFGALCLTSAMMISKGNALLVMPIVFGGAVSVTAIVSVIRLHEGATSPMLWVGIFVTVIGVVITAQNTPHGHTPSLPTPAAQAEQAAVDPPPVATEEDSTA
ncbi:MAG: hypothetical protein ACYTGQ_00800 [Planctomycetota bacterium]|jgi:drug/metabolite transporter (DMT)-like permease